ncbi:MAG TPA: AraC family transcriptional regulator [Candidatus Avanaerovorax faecigallinarum]|nr:AraC family transcriptional regulator [Candidatus Avanaerovorax faecigallinarum]
MLFERTAYEDDFPINIRIFEVDEYPVHYHQDIEFVYVLRGTILLKNGYYTYTLKEGDIFINSGHEVHGLLHTEERNLVAVIQVSNWFFTRYFPSLPLACFRTYTRDEGNTRLDNLRYMMLQILLNYCRRSFNYKSKCTLLMVDVIEYINKWFNLFAFDGDTVVNSGSDDPIIIGRISRIITYIYANHSGRITLDDIAAGEHLSSYYISHLIKDYMGISFQEFLCFARVESSEIQLLETDDKISAVARSAGFSTTAYYEKYFRKWFHTSPSEHREKLKKHILSSENMPEVKIPPESVIIPRLQRYLSVLEGQNPNTLISGYHQISLSVDPSVEPVMDINHRLHLIVTPEDVDVMGHRLWNALEALRPEAVTVSGAKNEPQDELTRIAGEINRGGFPAAAFTETSAPAGGFYGADSVAAFHHIFNRFWGTSQPIPCRLRDQGDPDRTLKGILSCYTSSVIPKPAFYAYCILSRLKGSLIYENKYYSVIKLNADKSPAYVILTMNYSEDIEKLCTRKNTPFDVNSVISGFTDQVDINITIPVDPGKYNIIRFAFEREDNIFAYMAQLGFPDKSSFPGDWRRLLTTTPHVNVSPVTASDNLNLNIAAKGVSFQITAVIPAD